MTFGVAVFLLAVIAILAVALFFLVCRRYEEGVFGNLFLGLMVIACALVLWDAAQGALELPPPAYRLMVLCFAVFVARHAYRFAMFHWHGWFGWQPPADMKNRAAEQ